MESSPKKGGDNVMSSPQKGGNKSSTMVKGSSP